MAQHNFRTKVSLPQAPAFFGDSGGRWGSGIPTQFPAGFGDSGGRWGSPYDGGMFQPIGQDMYAADRNLVRGLQGNARYSDFGSDFVGGFRFGFEHPFTAISSLFTGKTNEKMKKYYGDRGFGPPPYIGKLPYSDFGSLATMMSRFRNQRQKPVTYRPTEIHKMAN